MTKDLSQPVSRLKVVIGISLAIGSFVVLRVCFSDFAALTTALVMEREGLLLLFTVTLVLYVIFVEGRAPSDLGFKPVRWGTVGWGFIVCVTLVLVGVTWLAAMRALGVEQESGTLKAIAERPAWMILVIASTAGVCEEIAFRGVLIDHFAKLTDSAWAGAIVSIVAFSALHMNGWRLTQLFFVAPSAIVLTVFFLWKRDLVACMIGHALTDMLGLFLAAAAPDG